MNHINPKYPITQSEHKRKSENILTISMAQVRWVGSAKEITVQVDGQNNNNVIIIIIIWSHV